MLTLGRSSPGNARTGSPAPRSIAAAIRAGTVSRRATTGGLKTGCRRRLRVSGAAIRAAASGSGARPRKPLSGSGGVPAVARDGRQFTAPRPGGRSTHTLRKILPRMVCAVIVRLPSVLHRGTSDEDGLTSQVGIRVRHNQKHFPMAFIGKCYAGAGRTTKRNRRNGLPGQVFSRRTWQRLWRPSLPDDFWHSCASYTYNQLFLVRNFLSSLDPSSNSHRIRSNSWRDMSRQAPSSPAILESHRKRSVRPWNRSVGE